LPESSKPLVEVILLSQNTTDTGLRIFNSIDHFKLNITRAAFISGMSPYGDIAAFVAHLFYFLIIQSAFIKSMA